MKYTMTDQWFELGGKLVKPFNGETRMNQPSWTHGFTHFEDKDGVAGVCAIGVFEQHAREWIEPEPTAVEYPPEIVEQLQRLAAEPEKELFDTPEQMMDAVEEKPKKRRAKRTPKN